MRIKRYAAPVITGVVVLGAVTAFAAGFSVTSNTVVSGNAAVSACNSSASASYTTEWEPALSAYKVATTPISTATGCANMAYKVTLTGSGGSSLAELTGALGTDGGASPNFSGNKVPAASIVGISVAITG